MRLPLKTRSAFLDSERADGHTRFRIHGAYDLRDLEIMIPAILAEVVRQGHERAFIDISSMTGDIPDVDRFTLAQGFAELWGSRNRAAIRVDPENQRVNRLFETVAVNRSAQVRVGGRNQDLLDWLLAE